MNKFAKIGIIVGILGGVAGILVPLILSIASGDWGGVLATLLISSVFILVFGGVFWAVFKPMVDQKAILKNGEPGEAKVLELRDTGVTLNNDPQIKLILEVTPKKGEKYTTEMKVVISRLQTSLYQPGQTLQVMIDKNDKNKVAIAGVGGGGAAFSGMSKEEAEKKLKKIADEDTRVLKVGLPAKAIVMEYTELGINVDGPNPVASLKLQVIPEKGDSFKAATICAIMQKSVSKYLPGNEVNVKYDPKDKKKVAIVGST